MRVIEHFSDVRKENPFFSFTLHFEYDFVQAIASLSTVTQPSNVNVNVDLRHHAKFITYYQFQLSQSDIKEQNADRVLVHSRRLLPR